MANYLRLEFSSESDNRQNLDGTNDSDDNSNKRLEQ